MPDTAALIMAGALRRLADPAEISEPPRGDAAELRARVRYARGALDNAHAFGGDHDTSLDLLAVACYEGHALGRAARHGPQPKWHDLTPDDRADWRAAADAVVILLDLSG